jgi:hypothetical protein
MKYVHPSQVLYLYVLPAQFSCHTWNCPTAGKWSTVGVAIRSVKNTIFWDVMLCGSFKNRRFGGLYHLRHQGDKNWQARNNVISSREACFNC